MSTGIPKQQKATYKHLFGPVPSRRLGRSLGVDIIPHKTCTFNCVFCEVGSTTRNTSRRRQYVSIDDVVAELRDWLNRGGRADHITLSGSGEPTLHAGFGRLFDEIHRMCAIKTALLTNSSLLHLPEVRAAAARADIVKVSLSAWDENSFDKINQPYKRITLKQLLAGLVAFRAEFKGELWLEVVAIAGMNDTVPAMRKIANLAKKFAPDRIHLNTVVRPPTEPVEGVPRRRLEQFANLFTPKADVVGEMARGLCPKRSAEGVEIAAMLKRRPCTLPDVVAGLGLQQKDAARIVNRLVHDGKIRREKRGAKVYYVCG